MAVTAGYDVGGAHLKVALSENGRPIAVEQIAPHDIQILVRNFYLRRITRNGGDIVATRQRLVDNQRSDLAGRTVNEDIKRLGGGTGRREQARRQKTPHR